MNRFSIHPILRQDCRALGWFPVCHVLLHNNATIPWVILVPETDAGDLFELEDPIKNQVFAECDLTSTIVRSHFRVSRINFAQIGNIVPQLHLHVVGRSEGDACWPAPVWGNAYPRTAYAEEHVVSLTMALQGLPGFTPAHGS